MGGQEAVTQMNGMGKGFGTLLDISIYPSVFNSIPPLTYPYFPEALGMSCLYICKIF